MKQKILCVLLAGILFVGSSRLALAAPTIDDIRREKAQTEQELNAIQNEIGGLQGEKDAVEEELEQHNETLVQTMASISMLEEEILKTQAQIVIKEKEYAEAQAREEEQYQAMVTRIKFMYEQGDINYVELLLQAESFSDMLNKADYVEEIYAYDRSMLEKFQAAKEAVAAAKAELEEAKAEEEASQESLKEEKAYLEELIDEKEAEAADYASQISRASQEAAAYKAKIKQQNSQIKKLEEEERKRQEEERKRKEAAAGNNGGSGNSGSNNGSPGVTPGNPSYTVPEVGGSGTGADIARYACQFVGNPYRAGGTSLTDGADCSGFTWAVYKHFGYSLPRTSSSQRSAGREVSYSEAQPGDIICYPGHVAIYIGGGRIVHASTAATGIKISNATYREMLSIRRIV